jgi:hypothetical protein
MNHVMCPLCSEGRMFLTEMHSNNKGNENKSYMWICEACPGILIEWWDGTDTDAVADYLDGQRHHVIKQWGPPEEETNAGSKNLLKEE